jgi:lipopolysaccharide assembly protein A
MSQASLKLTHCAATHFRCGPRQGGYTGLLRRSRHCAKNKGMKLFSWLLTFVVLVLALSFALHNRANITVSLWPFGVEVVTSLYILSIGTLFLGFLLGAVFGWAIHVPHRMEARRLRRHVADLKEKIEDMRNNAGAQGQGISRTLMARLRGKRRFWERRS